MSGIAFVTHPSVRIKGSENVYSPVQCVDDLCPIGPPHMHCPFCVKTESYTDPVILKAHYRVKHVDKGIEFAGLKILRCCEHCDIVGVIKGEKKFKGAHWHCYRCRNGFNRRDEAIKHYKTHFRNPQTTFQISITSDLNSPVPTYQQSQDPPRAQQPSSNIQTSQPDNTLPANHEIIHPALTEAVSCISSPVAVNDQDIGSNTVALTNGKVHDGAVHVSIEAACNSVDVTNDEEQAIIVIQEQQLDSTDLDSSFAPIVNNEVSIVSEKEGQEKGVSMAERVQLLEQDKVVLKKEVQKLRKQVERLEDVVRTCKKREEELTARLGNATERGITEMLQKMESEHRNLLRQQLDTLHQTYMASRSPSSTVLQLTDHSGQEIQVVSAASLEAFLASTVNTTSTSEGHATLPTTTIIQAGDLTLEQVSGPSSNNTAVVTTGQTLTSSNTELGSGSYVMCVQSVKTEKEDHEREEEEEEEEEEEGGKEKVAGEVKLPVDETAKTEEPPAKKAKTK